MPNITLENAWVVVLIVGGLILMPLLIGNLLREMELQGYVRRARKEKNR